MTLAAIVLAAGTATRFGGDKLSALLDGKPLVHHAIECARAAPVDRVLVIARDTLDIGDWPSDPEVRRIEIDSDALSTSLKAGIAAASGADGAFVFLGDMPRVPHGIAHRLAAMLGDSYAAIARNGDSAGHPVLLSARAFPDIAAITGDEGAGKLLKQRKDVAWLECRDSGILLDIDRPHDLDRLQQRPG